MRIPFKAFFILAVLVTRPFTAAVVKKFSLHQIKLSVLEVHKKYQDLKSEVKDVIVEGNRIAFRVEQHAFFVPHT